MRTDSPSPKLAPFVLLLAAHTLAAGPVFTITDFGARADGTTPATAAFRAAVRAAVAAGGGTIEVPAGRYVTGPIELASDLTLHLSPGAVLRFPAERLPFTKGREQGIECLTPVPLIGGRDLDRVAVTGEGVLTTDNADWLKLMGRTRAHGSDPGTAFGPAWEHLLLELQRRTPAAQSDYLAAAPELRPSFVRFMNCRHVEVSGVRFAGSPMWTVHLLYCDHVIVLSKALDKTIYPKP